jgi:hypothetical protein
VWLAPKRSDGRALSRVLLPRAYSDPRSSSCPRPVLLLVLALSLAPSLPTASLQHGMVSPELHRPWRRSSSETLPRLRRPFSFPLPHSHCCHAMAMLTNEHRHDAPSRPSTIASTVAKTLTPPFRHPNRLTSLPPLKIPSKPAGVGKKGEEAREGGYCHRHLRLW